MFMIQRVAGCIWKGKWKVEDCQKIRESRALATMGSLHHWRGCLAFWRLVAALPLFPCETRRIWTEHKSFGALVAEDTRSIRICGRLDVRSPVGHTYHQGMAE